MEEEEKKKPRIILNVNWTKLSLRCASGSPIDNNRIKDYLNLGENEVPLKNHQDLENKINEIKCWTKKEGKELIINERGEH